MNRASWSPEELAEYEAALKLVVETADSTRDRVDVMERVVDDAIQAHRFWARDCDREARRAGYATQIKAYLKRTRVVFVSRNATVEKPRVVGFKRRSADGVVYDVQALLETATFDELYRKRQESLQQVKSYSDTVALLDRLIALKDLHPTASTVAEALTAHGTSLDEYLGLPEANAA
jgi:hypothetical protein